MRTLSVSLVGIIAVAALSGACGSRKFVRSAGEYASLCGAVIPPAEGEEPEGHRAVVTFLAFSEDSRKLVTKSSFDGLTRVWDVDTGNLDQVGSHLDVDEGDSASWTSEVEGCEDAAVHVGTRVTIVCPDGRIVTFEGQDGSRRKERDSGYTFNFSHEFRSQAFSKDGNSFVALGRPRTEETPSERRPVGRLVVVDVAGEMSPVELQSSEKTEGSYSWVHFLSESRRIAVVEASMNYEGQIFVWDTDDGSIVDHHFSVSWGPFFAMAVSPDERLMAIPACGCAVELLQISGLKSLGLIGAECDEELQPHFV